MDAEFRRRFHTLPTSIADELAEFGPYLTMRGAREGEQRLGAAELPLASILIAA